jgi:UDP:flavonoid glycosyltransferase YjiC (YdhE family)
VRTLFTTQPGHGHLNPMLPYASALRDAGHEVRFATAPSFCATVRRLDFPVSPAGHDFTWEHAVDFFPEMATAAAEGPPQVNELSQRIVWEHWTPRMTEALLELVADWRPDLIVREAAEYGGSIAGRAAGVPVACALWGAPFHDSAWDRHLAVNHTSSGYRAQSERLGVSSDARTALAGELMLSTLPPSWMAAGDTGLGRIEHFRSEPQDRAEGERLDPALTDRRSGGLIYATLGTVHNKQHRLRKAMLAALADVPASVIFTTGPGIDIDRVGDPGENIALESFVPQSLIIPRADLVLSHAGLGTIIGALYAGVPMVLISIAVDHPINAERAAALGVARVLDAADCQPEQLRETIVEALADEDLRKRATEVRDECLALPEITQAVEVLEAYAIDQTSRS